MTRLYVDKYGVLVINVENRLPEACLILFPFRVRAREKVSGFNGWICPSRIYAMLASQKL